VSARRLWRVAIGGFGLVLFVMAWRHGLGRLLVKEKLYGTAWQFTRRKSF
jgi:hypothetical protein